MPCSRNQDDMRRTSGCFSTNEIRSQDSLLFQADTVRFQLLPYEVLPPIRHHLKSLGFLTCCVIHFIESDTQRRPTSRVGDVGVCTVFE